MRKICIPQFYYIKVMFNGVFIARICFPDDSPFSFKSMDEEEW